MHFNFITSLTLITSLTGNALAMPASNQSPNILKRAEYPDYNIKYYTDTICDKYTGSYSHNKPTCQNLDDFAVDILSINGEVDGAILDANNCGWRLYAYPEYDCEGGGEWWNWVTRTSCGKHPSKRTPIKSFEVIHNSAPCQ